MFGGTLVYKQSFPAVSLADGVFSVHFGPTGEASDAPTNPLTTDLATAIGGDGGATSPVRFLEVTVGTDGATTRTQVLASGQALRDPLPVGARHEQRRRFRRCGRGDAASGA